MAILYMDNFRTYPTAAEMLADGGKGGPWTTLDRDVDPLHTLIDNPTWRGDDSNLRALSNDNQYDRRSPQRDFNANPVKSVCAQFICGTAGGTKTLTESCNVVFFQEPVIDKDTASPSALYTFYGVSIRAATTTVGATNQVGVYYTIMTNATGSTNQALIGYLRPWTRDRHYHVEVKIDHTNPQARIIVYVNGVLELDATYDRDRIDSGFQTKDFKRVLLGGGTGSSNRRPPMYSNLVIYTDEAGTVFPMGPIDLETLSPTAGQGYDGLRAAPSADDSTYATVVPGGTLSGSFDDLASNPNPVLAVDLTIRHGSVAGIEPSQITTRVLKSGGAQMVGVTTTSAPGTPATHRRVRLPAGTTAADVNGATFTINAAV